MSPDDATVAKALRRPVPIDPVGFEGAVHGLTPSQVGGVIRLALRWWPSGELPRTVSAASAACGLSYAGTEALLPLARPLFQRGGYFAVLRSATIAKTERRAKAGRMGALSRARDARRRDETGDGG